jgi:putative oxidoreductase
MKDLGVAALRLTQGSLLTGHGAQKLFGWFGGHGPAGTGGWLESMGLRPGKAWAYAAGLGELGGGLLTALGFLHPLGPIGVMSSMAVAQGKAHADKPIWVTEGGGELVVTNMAIATSLIFGGPGALSLDRALGIRLPTWVAVLATAACGASVAYALLSAPKPVEQPAPQVAQQSPDGAPGTEQERTPTSIPI